MSITYEEAVDTLCAMFENWDRQTIVELFESNGYHVERTIETILSMDQPNAVAPSASTATSRYLFCVVFLCYNNVLSEIQPRWKQMHCWRNSWPQKINHASLASPILGLLVHLPPLSIVAYHVPYLTISYEYS